MRQNPALMCATFLEYTGKQSLLGGVGPELEMFPLTEAWSSLPYRAGV